MVFIHITLHIHNSHKNILNQKVSLYDGRLKKSLVNFTQKLKICPFLTIEKMHKNNRYIKTLN